MGKSINRPFMGGGEGERLGRGRYRGRKESGTNGMEVDENKNSKYGGGRERSKD